APRRRSGARAGDGAGRCGDDPPRGRRRRHGRPARRRPRQGHGRRHHPCRGRPRERGLMPVFAYRARTAAGRAERGLGDAESLRSAWQQLRTRGVFPTELHPRPTTEITGRVTPDELAAMLRQLATLLAGGVPIADALAAVAEETSVAAL